MSVNTQIFVVEEVGKKVTDKNAEGYLGLLPNENGSNILTHLVETNQISKQMFSLFIKLGST